MPEQTNVLRAIDAAKYFTPYTPIEEAALFSGRLDQIIQVTAAVRHKGLHAILFGERGVGKTSLSLAIRHFLRESQLICIRISCHRADTFGSVWTKLFNEIELETAIPVPGFGNRIEKTRARVSDTLPPELSANDIRIVLKQLSEDAVLILIFDEFDRLPTAARGVFADLIKMLSDFAVPATLVLVGLSDSVDELIVEHESVDRALVQVRLPRMSQDEIAQILDNGLAALEMEIEPEAKNRIVLLSQGLPHYAHLLGLHSVRAALLNGAIDLVTNRDVNE